MKKYLQIILMPIYAFLYSLALSLYGLKIQKIRYSGNYDKYYKSCCNNISLKKQELISNADRKIEKLVREAYENVPYYRKLYKANGIDVSGVSAIRDIGKLPIIDKECVRSAPREFVDDRLDIRKLLNIHTTGTTGTPLNIYCTREARQKNYAFYNRFLNQAGIDVNQKRATFGGRIVVPSWQVVPPFWRYSFFQKNLLCSSYHLTDRNMPAYISKLRLFKPDYIDSYPSSIYTVAKYAQDRGISLAGITGAITTSAETLFPQQREIIEAAFEVPIYDQYGAAEMCIFVGQCRHGNYHIHTDYGVVEFLNDDGRAVEPGEEAEIVCTGFVNKAMPLIRYRIGDRGVLADSQCDCGSNFPVLDKLLGRIDDVIVTPDGRKVGRLSPVVKGFPIKEVQYIQRKRSSVEVVLVKADGFDSETERKLLFELRKRLGEEIEIILTYTSRIDRGKGNKLKSVVSLVEK